MKKKIKKTGKVFWITGFSGAGKTEIAKKIFKKISKKYGRTILVSGDDLRDVFLFKKYDQKSRLDYGYFYSKFCQLISNKGINVIIATVCLFEKIRKLNRKKIKNYIEIYIEADLDQIIKHQRKKNIYNKKNNIIGKDIKAELPKNPDIRIINNFFKTIDILSSELINKIQKKYR